MKYWTVLLWWVCLTGGAMAAESGPEASPAAQEAPIVWNWQDKDLDLQCLREAYPAHIEGMLDDKEGTWLVLRGGRRVLYAVPPQERPGPLTPEATVRQSMVQIYPLEPARPVPGEGVHPGRVRSEDLLEALYGGSAGAVRAQLRPVALAGSGVLFSSATGAEAALHRVAAGLDALLRSDPSLRRWVLPLGGTFKWRRVAGEERLSPHSFGMAVDLNPKKGAYWRWSGGASHPAQPVYPSAIVKLFEDNGFVWGGKWREYDLMHFEYRPEILCKARRMQERAHTSPAENMDGATNGSPLPYKE